MGSLLFLRWSKVWRTFVLGVYIQENSSTKALISHCQPGQIKQVNIHLSAHSSCCLTVCVWSTLHYALINWRLLLCWVLVCAKKKHFNGHCPSLSPLRPFFSHPYWHTSAFTAPHSSREWENKIYCLHPSCARSTPPSATLLLITKWTVLSSPPLSFYYHTALTSDKIKLEKRK